MKSDRHNQIVNMIARDGMVKNPQLMEMFDISIETVRRDLEFLEQQGYLRRVYGGAVANVSLRSEPEYASRSKTRFDEKNAIAAAAAKLITPEDTLYLGVGTTVQAMVQYMKGFGELTVFTNALRTAVELSEMPGCTVILPGGQLRNKELTLSGFPAEDNLLHFNVDKAFIGIGGINETGVSDFHMGEANLHRKLIRNARQAIALADSTKLGVRAMNNVCGLEELDILITDSGISKEMEKTLTKAGVQVIVADR
ncbi:MAG: DeoR/GlpR transcriptional regulator [Oscillospiraceae bacterium]|nr:DeoR/GlpR transcriptional regulator [Oscillospiraceae bacterium]